MSLLSEPGLATIARFRELVPAAKDGPLEDAVFVHDATGRDAMLYAGVESQSCFLGWK